jgi:hypothetical protein
LSFSATVSRSTSHPTVPHANLARFRSTPDRPHAPSCELVEVADDGLQSFKIFAVSDPEALVRSSELLCRRFAWRGYSVPTLGERRRSRITLSAFQDDQVIATLTVGLDGANGLAVESVYPDCVRELRSPDRRFCEFTKFAVDEAVRSQALIGAIFHVACMYALELHHCTDALIEVNPRHVRFYERMLGFTQAAEQRLDPGVNAPAVLMRLDLQHSAREIDRLTAGPGCQTKERSCYSSFLCPETADQVLQRLRMH